MEYEKLQNDYKDLNNKLNRAFNIYTNTTKSLNQTFTKTHEELMLQYTSLKQILDAHRYNSPYVNSSNLNNKICPSILEQEVPKIYQNCLDGRRRINTSVFDNKKCVSNFNDTVPNTKAYHTCLELLNAGFNQSGIYNITPTPNYIKTVYCDQETVGGGWTVIMRNKYGCVTFDRTWDEYKNGFGNLNYDFWLGNEFLYRATTLYKSLKSKEMEIYIALQDQDDKNVYARYSTFFVKPENNKYELRISGYTGTAGNSMSHDDYKPFTTKDSDNDFNDDFNCASDYLAKGGWWYYNCSYSSLAKSYFEFDLMHQKYWPAPQWYHLNYNYNFFTSATMMFREKI